MDRQTLSIMKACEAVGVSRRTIYNWIAAGKLEYVRTAGGSIRIFADTLWRDASSAPTRGGNAHVTAARNRSGVSHGHMQ
jgi:excisionase family DNA binding protein